MTDTRLTTAVLGLDDRGQFLLESISKIDHFDILAVADKNTEFAKKTAQQYDCSYFDDYRQLVIQNSLDCLIVAAPIHTCGEYIRMAMKKKFNILKLAPPAKNFEHALELVRLADEQGVKFAVANPARFTQGFLDFKESIHQLQAEHIVLVTAFCAACPKPDHSWLSDPKLAGGGVLLHDCYEIIDRIICNFPIPQQIYSLNTNTAADRQQRLCLAEDTCIVTMKFTDTFHANLIASRHIGPEQQSLKVYTKEKILTVTSGRFTVENKIEGTAEQFEYEDEQAEATGKMLTNFALSILSPDENNLCSTAAENLKNMAVIESAYLSARTGFPEQPRKILEIEHTEPANIWPVP